MARMLKRQPQLFPPIINHRPAKRNRTEVGLCSPVISIAGPRNREVPRNKRSRKGANSVPFPQRERIKQKYVAGKNISEIAEEERRHWTTVAKIVKEPDVAEYVKEVRARFYGALEEILLAAIEYAMHAKDGGWLAYEMLKDSGVIPQRDLKHHPALEMERPVAPETTESDTRKIARAMVEHAFEKHKFFETSLVEVDEAQVNRSVKARKDTRSAEKQRA
jgi:rubrerythrin